jgi:hypothetical protein
MTLQNEIIPPLEPADQKPQQGMTKYIVLFVMLFVLLGMEGYMVFRMYGQKKQQTPTPLASRIATPTTEQPLAVSPTAVPAPAEQIVASAPQNISINSIDSYFTEVQKELDSL